MSNKSMNLASAARLGLLLLIANSFAPAYGAAGLPQAAQIPASPAGRSLGTIKTINGNDITLTTDTGAVVSVTAQDSTRFLQIEPGEKDLKNAAKISLQDLQAGDRILAIGQPSSDGHIMASSIMAMKHAALAAKQQSELQDWQRRGMGGLVKAVDPAAGTIAISVAALGGAKSVTVATSKDTVFRRYAPNSVKFDDAKVGTIDQIKPGDQLRARGTRNPDGTQLSAEEIVSGSFRNLSGLISSIDPSANTLSLNDLATKKPVVVKIASDSQIRKLQPQMAQLLAAAAKSGAPGGEASGSGSAPDTPAGGTAPGGRGGGRGFGGRGGDLQQLLGRLPASTLADLQKGDAVMIVSTEGTASDGVTAITVLGGVEPLLQANGGQQMTLPPWSIGSGGDAAGPE